MNNRVNGAIGTEPSNDIDKLKDVPLFQATLGDLKAVIQSIIREELMESNLDKRKTGQKIYGIKAIANELGISCSTVNRFIIQGKLDGAIMRVGKSVVADVDSLWAIFQCEKELKYKRRNYAKLV